MQCLKYQKRAITQKLLIQFSQNFTKYFSHHPLSVDTSFKFLSLILFEIWHLQNFISIFSKGLIFTRGDNSKKIKNMCLLFFHEESIHEVSRRYLIPEYHRCKISGSKILKKGNNSKNINCMNFFKFFVKYSIYHPLSADTSFKFLAIILFEIRHLQNLSPCLSKGRNLTRGDNSGKTRYMRRLFFHEISIHEVFQSWGHNKLVKMCSCTS